MKSNLVDKHLVARCFLFCLEGEVKLSKPILATCDAGCDKTFTVTKFKTKKVKNGIEKTYFRCPHCKREYVAYYASKETTKLQRKMRKLLLQLKNKIGTPEGLELLRKQNELQMSIKQSMDEARRIVE